MENKIEGKIQSKIKLDNDDMISFSDIVKEREINFYNIRKNRIRNELFNKKKNYFNYYNNNNINNNSIDIQCLNINSQLKDEKYINDLLNSNKFNVIFEYIKEIYNTNNNFNIDIIKYGLFLLNEKLLDSKNENIIQDINFLYNNNFKEIIFLLLNYSKNENCKIDFEPIILKLTYQILANYCFYCPNNIDISFLFEQKFFELHLYFMDNISDKNIIENILLMTYNVCLDDNETTNKIFTFNDNKFFNSLIEYVNIYQNDNERIEIILDLFICYINIFDIYEKRIKNKKIDIIEMKDNSIKYDLNIFETIYEISLLLIYSKRKNIFNQALYLTSDIFKILYKSKAFEFISKIISDENTKLMLIYILEKDYSENFNNLIYISDLFKYMLKAHSKCDNFLELKTEIINLINEVEKNLNEYDEIIDIFIDLLSNEKKKLKDKIKIKLIEVISSFIINEYFYKNIIENYKEEVFEIIVGNINSSDYGIRKKIIKIVEYITGKRDFILTDYLVKNKLLYFIKSAIDPSVTYCSDEKLILGALKVIDNLLSIGEVFKKLNGINSILIEFINIGGRDLLDSLLCNKSELIYNNSLQLIKQYLS